MEVDLLIEQNQQFKAIEIKSGLTLQKSQFQSLMKFQQFAGNQENILVYGGKENQFRENLQIIGFEQIGSI